MQNKSRINGRWWIAAAVAAGLTWFGLMRAVLWAINQLGD